MAIRDSEFAVRQKIEETLQKYHSEHPYRYGMKKAEIHNTFLKRSNQNIFDAYIERMTGENVYGRREEYLRFRDMKFRRTRCIFRQRS